MKNSIKVERAKHDMSQDELAQRVEVSRLTIHSIERNKKKPSVELALKIAKVLDVQIESIFQLE